MIRCQKQEVNFMNLKCVQKRIEYRGGEGTFKPVLGSSHPNILSFPHIWDPILNRGFHTFHSFSS
jgi:hypothetical protein